MVAFLHYTMKISCKAVQVVIFHYFGEVIFMHRGVIFATEYAIMVLS